MFAVLLLPAFRLQAALRLREELWKKPLALVDETTTRGTVLELTPPAISAAVCVGMASTQAIARCPALQLLPRSPAQEAAAGAALLEVAGALSSKIEATGEGLCTMDLRTTKIADWQKWGTDAIGRLAALCLHAKIGIAANPDLALLAARSAESVLVVQNAPAFLSSLAVAKIDPPPELLAILRDWGVTHLGQLTHLPKGELVDRLGPEAGALWQRAAGRSERLLSFTRPAEQFTEVFDFEQEIETVDPLFFILRRFLDQLSLRLHGAGRVAGKMVLLLSLENRTDHERTFTIPCPTADPEVLFRILSTHLEGLHLEHRPIGTRLTIEALTPGSQQWRLFESPLRDPNRFGETLARLAALVGGENVGVAECEDTHRPDRFRLVPPRFEAPAEKSSDDTTAPRAMGLPLRRFRPRLRAQVQVTPDGPAYVVSETPHGAITAAFGPYRLSGHWWDSETWALEEWDIELADGGLFRLSRDHEGWFVEGCYDAVLR